MNENFSRAFIYFECLYQAQLQKFAEDQNVLVVSPSYRLGVFGFLGLPEAEKGEKNIGNWGLLDILAALKWTNKYIELLGGDKNKVTLSGCSSGKKLTHPHKCLQMDMNQIKIHFYQHFPINYYTG